MKSLEWIRADEHRRAQLHQHDLPIAIDVKTAGMPERTLRIADRDEMNQEPFWRLVWHDERGTR